MLTSLPSSQLTDSYPTPLILIPRLTGSTFQPMIPLLSYPIILPICSTLFPAYDSNFKSPNSFEGLQSPTRITMARRPKRTRLYLNNHIFRSQALAYLAQNEINQATVPAVQVEDSQSEVADVHHEQDEGDSVGKMLFEDDSDSSAGSTASIRDSVGEESFEDGRFPVRTFLLVTHTLPNNSFMLCWVVTLSWKMTRVPRMNQ